MRREDANALRTATVRERCLGTFVNTRFVCLAAALAWSLHIASADTKETPVGVVLSGTGSKLLRADTLTPLAALPGDRLFAGDAFRTETDSAKLLFCPSTVIQT